MSDVIASAMVPLTRPVVTPIVDKKEDATLVAVPAVSTEVPAVDAAAPAPETPVAPAPVDFAAIIQPFSDELSTTGVLSTDSLKSLAEKLGAPLEVVELTYEGMRSRQSQRNNEILVVAGGQPQYDEMVKWASETYNESERETFNAALVGGTKDSALAAVNQLRQKFTAVNGSPTADIARAQQTSTAPVTQKSPAAPSLQPFASFREQMEAQKDKRYFNDPTYALEVYNRVAISKYHKG